MGYTGGVGREQKVGVWYGGKQEIGVVHFKCSRKIPKNLLN